MRKSQEWRQLGVSIFGGCCGIGTEHIAALHAYIGGGILGTLLIVALIIYVLRRA